MFGKYFIKTQGTAYIMAYRAPKLILAKMGAAKVMILFIKKIFLPDFFCEYFYKAKYKHMKYEI